jgi:hypothetical protein
MTNHAKGGQKVVQLTSRWVINAIQSNVSIAGDKDMIGESLEKKSLNLTKKSRATATDIGDRW